MYSYFFEFVPFLHFVMVMKYPLTEGDTALLLYVYSFSFFLKCEVMKELGSNAVVGKTLDCGTDTLKLMLTTASLTYFYPQQKMKTARRVSTMHFCF